MQAVNNISENSSKPIKFNQSLSKIIQSINLEWHTCDKNYKDYKNYKVAFTKAKNFLVVRCIEKRVNWKKTKDGENIFFKALANRFRLILKLIKRVKE